MCRYVLCVCRYVLCVCVCVCVCVQTCVVLSVTTIEYLPSVSSHAFVHVQSRDLCNPGIVQHIFRIRAAILR